MLHTYKIWTDDGVIEKENAREIRHVDPQAAIEEVVEIYDRNSAEYYFAHNFALIILFCEDESGEVTKWNLAVEAAPQYYATEIK